jgi:formylglycine-generating enzyme required for sulfatase activity
VTPLKPTGFWSYTSADDAASDGRLSRLRTQLANRLRVQLGRPVHLFQDVAAIPPGTLWQQQIESALAEASFVIPIITPGFLQSEWCAKEVRLFRDHMRARGRDDLILPVHYIDVSAFSTVRRGDCCDPEVLDYLRSLQWVDFRSLEPLDANTSEVRIWLGQLARRIEEALWRVTPPPAKPEPRPLPAEIAPPANPPSPGPVPSSHPTRDDRVRFRNQNIAWLAAAIVVPLIFYFGIPTKSPSPPDRVMSAPKSEPASSVTTPPKPVPPPESRPSELRDPCPSTAICPDMVLIPHGSFQMGTTDEELVREKVPETYRSWELPRHTVTIASDFYIAKYPVTVGEFKAFVRAKSPALAGGCYTFEKGIDGKYGWTNKFNRTWENPGFPQTDPDPVVCVSYADAQAYVEWLNTNTETKSYRLPSEAEWEYAARAGTSTARFWGDSRDPACRFANVADRTLARQLNVASPDPERFFACDDGFAFTAPVGAFERNPFGLYDMLGNVWQWTIDCWNEDYKNAPSDGSARPTGDCSRRVVRGGSWDNDPRDVRAGNRGWNDTDNRGTGTGFRVARTL